jgi:glycosyltransferase involved in cell wall biosynthesis
VSDLTVSLDVSAVPLKLGGAGYYTLQVARGLVAQPGIDLTMVSRRDDTLRWEEVAHGAAAVQPKVPSSRPGRLVFEQVRFHRLLARLSVQVHHAPHYTMPERAGVPCVVTIHDCTFFDHPEWHVRSKAALFRRAIRQAARQAGALICVSQVTAERLRASCEVTVPIVVAPHGVDHQRFAPLEPAEGSDQAILRSLGVPPDRPLVAFLGTLEPRKGVAPLVAAFDRVADRHPEAVLVLGGQTGWGLAETERALAAASHPERIIRTGYLPDAAVPALLRQAAVVAYPALEEGFGLPALEALACGASLITTEGTAMAEFAGEAAYLIPPGQTDPLAETLSAVLDAGPSSGEAERRRHLGIEVASHHTWAASLALHLDAYYLAAAASQ